MKIPFTDLPAQNAECRADIDAAIKDYIDRASFITGPDVEQFEHIIADYLQADDCAATGSGTTALQVALLACGVGKGDEVISTSHTFVSTPEAIINPFKKFLTSEIGKKTQEELFLWNKNQAYLALGNLLTVCALEKIDACPMEGFVPKKYDEILNLTAQNLKSILVLPVGFRAEDCHMKDLAKVRKEIQETVIEIY